MKTLILFGGGRPLPGLLATSLIQPDVTQVVLPTRVESRLAATLRSLFPKCKVVDAKPLSVNDPLGSAKELRSLLDGAAGEIHISVTGTPLPLAIVALDIARERGLPVHYLDTATGTLMNLARPGEHSRHRFDHITVREYLRICGLKASSVRTPAAQKQAALACARLLVARGPTITSALIASLRAAKAKDRPEPTVLELGRLDKQSRELLDELADLELLQVTNKTIVLAGMWAWRLLDGGWLETVAEEAASVARDPDGQPLFSAYQSEVRFEDDGAVREIDLVALRGATPLVASCKSSRKPPSKAVLDELNAVARVLGQEYCARVMVHSERPTESALWRTYLNHADHLGIAVCTGDDLERLADVFAEEFLNPTHPRR